MTVQWNVVRRGHVLGQVLASDYSGAVQAARDVYGAGVRVGAPGDPNAEMPRAERAKTYGLNGFNT
jgi:hypothetical protein